MCEFERVGARGGRQAGKAELAVVEAEGEGFTGFELGFGIAGEAEQDVGRFATGGDDVAQLRHLPHYGGQVEGFDDAQVRVGGVAFFADGATHAGADGDAACFQEGADARGVEAFFARDFKVFGVVVVDGAIDAPHVVLVVRVVKFHAAFFGRRREAAAHHHGGVRRQHRREGVGFDVHDLGWVKGRRSSLVVGVVLHQFTLNL